MRILLITTDNYPNFGTTVNIFNKLLFDGGLLKKNNNVSLLTMKYSLKDRVTSFNNIDIYPAESWVFLPIREYLENFSRLCFIDKIKIPLIKIYRKLRLGIYGGTSPLLEKMNIEVI